MLRNKLNNKKKKKGFTLIELVIVLAVLAIIAVIAIPNLTKVKDQATNQADEINCEQVEGIVQLAIVDEILLTNKTAADITFEITFDDDVTKKDSKERILISATAPYAGLAANKETYEDNFQTALIDVNVPKSDKAVGYTVKMTPEGKVAVGVKRAS